jgi:small subunit ribosomal protein S17
MAETKKGAAPKKAPAKTAPKKAAATEAVSKDKGPKHTPSTP